MVDHDGEIAVAALVGDLIDPEPTHAIQPITEHSVDVGPDASDDRSDRAPRDPHQLRDRGLRALRRQPRHLLIELAGMPGAVPGPRHRGDHDPVLRAANTRRVGFQEHDRRPHVQRPPTPPAVTTVITRATPPARTAAISFSPVRPHDDHQLAALPMRTSSTTVCRRPSSRPHTLMPRTSLPPSQDSSREEAGTLGAKRRALLPRAHSTHGSISRAAKPGNSKVISRSCLRLRRAGAGTGTCGGRRDRRCRPRRRPRHRSGPERRRRRDGEGHRLTGAS